jgi:hypothetical protein
MVSRLVGHETPTVTKRPARLTIAAAALLAGSVGAAVTIDAPGTAAAGAPPDRAAQPPPNVIVVMTDDQSVGELSRRTMPHTI